jgi:hypothetical protein
MFGRVVLLLVALSSAACRTEVPPAPVPSPQEPWRPSSAARILGELAHDPSAIGGGQRVVEAGREYWHFEKLAFASYILAKYRDRDRADFYMSLDDATVDPLDLGPPGLVRLVRERNPGEPRLHCGLYEFNGGPLRGGAARWCRSQQLRSSQLIIQSLGDALADENVDMTHEWAIWRSRLSDAEHEVLIAPSPR